VFIQSIWIITVAPVGWTTRGLDVSNFVWTRPEGPQEGFRRHGARANFSVIRLLQNASLLSPEAGKTKDDFLVSKGVGFGHGRKYLIYQNFAINAVRLLSYL